MTMLQAWHSYVGALLPLFQTIDYCEMSLASMFHASESLRPILFFLDSKEKKTLHLAFATMKQTFIRHLIFTE